MEVVRFLLANGADLHAQDDDGYTALIYAAWEGDVEVVRFLLDNGANLHTSTGYGYTALMYAAQKRSTSRWCGFLLANGADLHVRKIYTARRP